MERENAITFQGNPLTLVGDAVSVGQLAPDFTAAANDLSPYKLSDDKGKVVIISAVPSLDTPVCDTQTRKFNEAAAALGDAVVIVTVSMDLPFAQKRWCGAAGVERVITLSDHRDTVFGAAFGVLIKELRLLGRSIFILDRNGIIRYIQNVKELSEEPNYDAVLEAVQKLV